MLLQTSVILFYLYKIGPFFLFIALLLGIVGLPIPDEILLMSAGYLIAHQKLNLFYTLVAAISGSIVGITISYLLGRLVGKWVLKKYGKALHLTEEKIQVAHTWFERFGKWILVIGYYIPLFRHVFGFVAGGANLDYKNFALFAYSGALIWCLTFLGIGYYFPDYIKSLFSH